jgi:hypothetical protein
MLIEPQEIRLKCFPTPADNITSYSVSLRQRDFMKTEIMLLIMVMVAAGVSGRVWGTELERVSLDACKGWMGDSFFMLNKGEQGYAQFVSRCVDMLYDVQTGRDCRNACGGLYKATFNLDQPEFQQAFSDGCVKQCVSTVERYTGWDKLQSSPVAMK